MFKTNSKLVEHQLFFFVLLIYKYIIFLADQGQCLILQLDPEKAVPEAVVDLLDLGF